jgi:hypothetical protein
LRVSGLDLGGGNKGNTQHRGAEEQSVTHLALGQAFQFHSTGFSLGLFRVNLARTLEAETKATPRRKPTKQRQGCVKLEL